MMALSLLETGRDGAAPWMQPFDESERRTKHLEVLSQLSGCFAASTLDEASSCLIRVLRLTFEFDVLEVTLFTGPGEGVRWHVRETGPGSPPDIPTEEAVRWVHRRQRVLWSGRQDREPWSLTSDDPVSPRGTHGRAFCALPLSTPQRRLGALFVSGARAAGYSGHDVRLLTRIAEHVSVAFDHMLSRAALRHERDRVDLLLRLSTTVASPLAFPRL